MAINLRQTVNKDKLKAKFEAESNSSQGPSDFLPYFKLKNKDSVTLRFLSDANPDNQETFTYTEEIFNFNGKNMKFDGNAKDCPASKIASELFAEAKEAGEETAEGKELRERALKFYKKRKYLANAYIVDAPEYFWTESSLDSSKIEDRVKVISLPKKVYDSIKDTVMDDDFEGVEFYNFGDNVVNFKLTVKKNSGGFNDYTASKFEIKSKALDVSDGDIDEIAGCLKDLSTLFKAHSLKEFNAAIDTEMNGEDDEEDTKNETSRKQENKATSTSNSTRNVKPTQPVVDTTDDEDSEDSEEESKKDTSDSTDAPVKEVSSLRAGLLSRLNLANKG